MPDSMQFPETIQARYGFIAKLRPGLAWPAALVPTGRYSPGKDFFGGEGKNETNFDFVDSSFFGHPKTCLEVPHGSSPFAHFCC